MIRNLLTVDEQDIGSDSYGWEDETNATLSRSTVRHKAEPASLKVVHTDSSQDAVAVLSRNIAVTAGSRYRMCCYTSKDDNGGCSVTVSFLDKDGVVIDSFDSGATTGFSLWTFVSVVCTAPAGSVTARLYLTAGPGEPAWFDQVVFCAWPAELPNKFLRLVLNGVPAYMREADEQLAEPDIPLRRFLDVGTVLADDILTSMLAFDYISPVDGVQGYERSTLVQPEYYPTPVVAEARWLPWLAQLVGVVPVFSSAGGTLTPWFYFEDTYPTWNAFQDIDPAVNPEFPLTSLSRTSGTVTATLGAQSAGPSATPSVGDPVEVTGAAAFNGAFVVTSVSGGTVTWSDARGNDSAASATLTLSDVSWTEAEGTNPTAFDTLYTLKHLTHSAATGLRAGTIASIKAAARSVLEGIDLRASAARQSGVVTVTCASAHTLAAGDDIALYLSPVATLNIEGTVASVTGPTTFTVTSAGPDTAETVCWATNKVVQVTQTSRWNLTVNTIEAQTFASELLQKVVDRAKPAGTVITLGYTP